MVETYFPNMYDDQKTILKMLLDNVVTLQNKITSLSNENDILVQKNLKWADRPLINSLIRSYAGSLNGDFGKAWNLYKRELLYKHGIDLNHRMTNYLNTSGKRTEPKTLDMLDNSELGDAVATAISLCRENNINIDTQMANLAS